jgi:RimJ/RimL family protein N-acetyltransferase
LVEHAFSNPSVRCVAAETFPDLLPSIGVLVKSGFREVEPRKPQGPLRYELHRASN